jgi:pseudouridine-5'-phosphate glycosidase
MRTPALSSEAALALSEGGPVVALESTLITHGLPFPENLRAAREAEAAVRSAGAVPATIAVLDGIPTVGLGPEQMDRLASGKAAKASRRDLPCLAAGGATAGTTVSATLFIAARAGIRVFATGGIGGVHRGAESTFDVSADLRELASSPVAVFCAGAKSVLDIPKTLEVLESLGVPVIGFETGKFPAFYSRDSGLRLEHRCDSPAELAGVIDAHRRLGLPGGVLVAVPIPVEHALPEDLMDSAISRASGEAAEKGVSGKALTPFLLSRICELTGGRSLAANTALIRNNALIAARTAVELSSLS